MQPQNAAKKNHQSYFSVSNTAKRVENASSTVCKQKVFLLSTNDLNKH